VSPALGSVISAGIADATGAAFVIEACTPVEGGCIHRCYKLAGRGRAFFVKINAPERHPMFEAEAAGLAEMAATATVRVPAPVACGSADEAAWLVLEHIDFGEALNGSMTRLGEQLAALHRVTARQFGWRMDNTIGSTPQINTLNRDWIAFWREQRLGYQLTLAADNGAPKTLLAKGARLAERVDALFNGYAVKPALLHGDLWGGNAGFDRAGAPLVFDPAVYYGDREADVAMTELFGGFSAEFYAAYRGAYALDAGYAVRKQLYNLYHVFNHFNLFGGAYADQAQTLIERLLAEV
jgi:protein-ribulosamine 3-kinase